ncbi:YybH family protein [Inquilinus sp. NPDC058860]|uniref:YybH family protein n=1 Tax=Inquilinus sp. NPDC058860 TaxID=3346652 RepID=UPI00368777C4
MTDDERAIRDLVETWMEASKAGDTATVLSLMSDDVVFMVPGHEPFGKETFAAAAAGQSEFRIDGRGEIRELQVLGDWAWLRSHLDVTMIPPVGQPVRRTGWTLTILHKQPDGRWLLTRDANLLTVQPAS